MLADLPVISRAFDVAWAWFLHATGSDAPGSVQYNFWSCFGSDLGEVAIIGGLIHVVHQHNCHQRGCWRLGLHKIDEHTKVCKKHHPGIPKGGLTAEELLAIHDRVKKPGTI